MAVINNDINSGKMEPKKVVYAMLFSAVIFVLAGVIALLVTSGDIPVYEKNLSLSNRS